MLIRYLAILLFSSLTFLPCYASNNAKNEQTTTRKAKNTYVEAFKNYANTLYSMINEPSLDQKVFELALKGYYQMQQEGKLNNASVISIVDFTKSANEKRFFLIDLISGKLLMKSLVAHGRNSGEEYATSFSNDMNSHKSSLGFYVTGETYDGDNGLSMRLDGVEPKVNDNARNRAIVVHAANYVSDSFISMYQRLGRSLGCPALPAENLKQIVDIIKDGSCMFLYYPDKKYLEKSHYVNAQGVFEYFTKAISADF